MPQFNQVIVSPSISASTASELIVEAPSDLACMAQWAHDNVIRIHRSQKAAHRCRWTFSVDQAAKHTIVSSLRQKPVAVYEADVDHHAFAVLYLPCDLFFPIVREVSGAVSVNIVREAPKWITI